ncbi:MAG: hypothetical protein WBO23_05535, partial [Burkholderiales bacterium]
MANPINASNAGLFSEAAYNAISSPVLGLLPDGWREDTTLSRTVGTTQFRVFFNDDTHQVVFAFRGTDNLINFSSDLVDKGASEYAQLHTDANTALSSLDPENPGAVQKYRGYQILAVGHSLGGGMAQS